MSCSGAHLVKQAIGDDRLWITPIVRMEIHYSTRSTGLLLQAPECRVDFGGEEV